MNDILVAYFSASGTTKRVAEKLANAIHADLFEIVPAQKYTNADLNWQNADSRSSVEMKNPACRPQIVSKTDLTPYRYVFIGFPVWWYRHPSIIDTFLEEYDFSGKTVIPFATSGGSSLGNTAKLMQEVCPAAKVVEGNRFSAMVSESQLLAWVKQIVK